MDIRNPTGEDWQMVGYWIMSGCPSFLDVYLVAVPRLWNFPYYMLIPRVLSCYLSLDPILYQRNDTLPAFLRAL